jgi:integrase
MPAPLPSPAVPTAVNTPAAPSAVLKTDALLAAYVLENPQIPKTLDKRRAALRGLERAAGHDDAARITKADVRKWKDQRIADGKALKTVADGVAMLRPVWAWAVCNDLLTSNPLSGMAPKKVRGQPSARVPFNDADAVLILAAAREAKGFLRWLPWVFALTGCRIEEVYGAIREDVREVHGVWVLDVNPTREGRSLKTSQSQRLVPIHAALAREGFLKYVQTLKPASPLFPDLRPGPYGGRGEDATKRLARWVRGLGIDDPRKAPAHSWRHRMRTRSGSSASPPKPPTPY